MNSSSVAMVSGAALHDTDAQSWDAICVTGGEDQQARHHTQSRRSKWGNARCNSHEAQVLQLGKRADGFTDDAGMVSTCRSVTRVRTPDTAQNVPIPKHESQHLEQIMPELSKPMLDGVGVHLRAPKNSQTKQ